MKNILFAKIDLDANARDAGVTDAKIFFDGEIAVWEVYLKFQKCEFEHKIYSVASPRDWWVAMRSREAEMYLEEGECLKKAFKNAKKEWDRMRAIARWIGVEWLDVSFLHAIQEGFNVFLRTDKLFCSLEQNFTLSSEQNTVCVQKTGEFFANMLSDNFSLFKSDFFAIGVHKELRLAYIDITKGVDDEMRTFISYPEDFDHMEFKKELKFGSFSMKDDIKKKVVVFIEDDEIVVKEVSEFPDKITIINDSDWFQSRPPMCTPKFPYATWHALRSKTRRR